MKRLIVVVAALVLMSFQMQAQNSSTITLESAVQTALERNITVIQSRNALDFSKAQSQQAFGNYLPSLDFSSGVDRSQSWSSGAVSSPVINTYNAGISSSVRLFNGFATTNNYKRAELNSEASEYNYSRTQQSTIYQTHQLYLNVVRTYQLSKVSEENLKRSQRQLERIEESNKVGAVALADVYRQRVQAGTDELSLIQAQSNYEKAKADLLAYLGVELDREYTFDMASIPANIDTAEFTGLNSQYGDFNQLVQAAMEKRPDLQSALATLNGSEAGVSAAKAAYLPVVDGSASYIYKNNEISSLTDNRGLGLGLKISLPIFNGFQTQTSIQEAQITKNNAEATVAQNQRQLKVDIRKALLDLEASEKEIKVTQASVTSAEMDQKIAQEKYNLGSGTLLDLLIANANLTQAQSNKVNAVNDYLLATKGVELATGTITK